MSAAGQLLGGEFESVDLILLPNGGAEQDPNAWWAAIRSAARRTIATSPDTPIAAVSVTTQWSGTVSVDESGKAIGNAIIWMDSRGAPYIEELITGPIRFEATTSAKRDAGSN